MTTHKVKKEWKKLHFSEKRSSNEVRKFPFVNDLFKFCNEPATQPPTIILTINKTI